MTTQPSDWAVAPKFGEWLRGIYASERNPLRDGMYVRTIRRTGRCNPGTFYELTDGKGEFWQYPRQSVIRLDRARELDAREGGEPRARVESNRCDCHPETCCCGPLALILDGNKVTTGYEARIRAIADAINATTRAAEAGEGWLRACDEEMVGAFLGVANAGDDYPTAKKKLHDLICWHTQVATDPAVNGGFVLVPLEPTPEMWKAGKAASCEAEQVYAQDRPQSVWERFGYRKNRVAHVYKAMLRAAMGAVGAKAETPQ